MAECSLRLFRDIFLRKTDILYVVDIPDDTLVVADVFAPRDIVWEGANELSTSDLDDDPADGSVPALAWYVIGHGLSIKISEAIGCKYLRVRVKAAEITECLHKSQRIDYMREGIYCQDCDERLKDVEPPEMDESKIQALRKTHNWQVHIAEDDMSCDEYRCRNCGMSIDDFDLYPQRCSSILRWFVPVYRFCDAVHRKYCAVIRALKA